MGGLGHLAIQYAHAFGYEVTAISSTAEKKEQALAFGADHFIFSGEQDNLRQANYSFDLLLCTGHDKVDWVPLMMTLKKKGRLVLARLPGRDAKFDRPGGAPIIDHRLIPWQPGNDAGDALVLAGARNQARSRTDAHVAGQHGAPEGEGEQGTLSDCSGQRHGCRGNLSRPRNISRTPLSIEEVLELVLKFLRKKG